MKPPVFLAASLLTLSLANFAHAQTTLAGWTFESATVSGTASTSTGPFLAELGLQLNTAGTAASGFHTSAATVYSSPAGNGSAKSLSSNTWATGDYYQFTLSTTGFTDLAVSFDQTSSATGPKDFKLSYSTDGTNFTDFTSYSPIVNSAPNAWSASTPAPAAHFSFDFSAVDAIENVSQVTFRLVVTDTTAENGNPVATAGTDRVDNFTVSTVPEPSAALAMVFGFGVIAFRRRRG